MDIGNTILAQLPGQERDVILPLLSREWLQADSQLLAAEERPDYVYFPESSIVSVALHGEDDRVCYLGLYGYEGFGAICTLLGAPTSPHAETVQCAGYAYRIAAADLRKVALTCSRLRHVLFCYVHVFMMQIAATALSNTATRLEQRLARWLLMYQDRSRENALVITHQRLSDMLGVRRSGVTEAIHLLEGHGMIKAQRGLVMILDRSRLETLTGGCYGRPEAEYRRLI